MGLPCQVVGIRSGAVCVAALGIGSMIADAALGTVEGVIRLPAKTAPPVATNTKRPVETRPERCALLMLGMSALKFYAAIVISPEVKIRFTPGRNSTEKRPGQMLCRDQSDWRPMVFGRGTVARQCELDETLAAGARPWRFQINPHRT
jgi:hypothetical protein